MIRKAMLLVGGLLTVAGAMAQTPDIPKVYSGITVNQAGKLGYRNDKGAFWPLANGEPDFTLSQMRGQIAGTDKGLVFDFQHDSLSGTLYYGFRDPETYQYPHPVFFKQTQAIEAGKATVNIADAFDGKYDMVGWQEKGYGTLGYRVTNDQGEILYDGKITFGRKENGRFYADTCLRRGPFVQNLQPDGATIMFETNKPVKAEVRADGKTFQSAGKRRHHEIELSGLSADKQYAYHVHVGNRSWSYQFRTAHQKGSEKAFTFAYASDSRAGQGGGERNIHGANAYIMKRIAALAEQEDAAFMQFTGDLVNGYETNAGGMKLEYANWMRSIEPFAHYLPTYVAPGNHEAYVNRFDNNTKYGITVDKFPFDKYSAETMFSQHFDNPDNGPDSEDGSIYDPEKGEQNFPDYKETAFHYTYGNVAVIALNSDYWYAPSLGAVPGTSGNLHGYIMDQQLTWLEEVLKQYEGNPGIDHIFLTLHTPFFPNGGHVDDDMWYNGSNEPRPVVNGRKVETGIIQRRDQLLELLVNRSEKVRAILTGDEHNYNRLPITNDMPRYPEGYDREKISLTDTIWQINNGAAGAPYYAKEKTPWMDRVRNFTTQNALVLFHVDGESIKVEVVNPDTLEVFDTFKLN